MDSIKKLNEVLQTIHVPIELKSFDDCLAALWIPLVEGLLGITLPNIERSPSNDTDRIENLETLISFLETALKLSLSHISATALLARDQMAVRHLAEIVYDIADSTGQLRQSGNLTNDVESVFSLSEPSFDGADVEEVTLKNTEPSHLKTLADSDKAALPPLKENQAHSKHAKQKHESKVALSHKVAPAPSIRKALQSPLEPFLTRAKASSKATANAKKRPLGGKDVLLTALKQEKKQLTAELKQIIDKVNKDAEETELKLDELRAITDVDYSKVFGRAKYATRSLSNSRRTSSESSTSSSHSLLDTVFKDMQEALGLPYEIGQKLYKRAMRGQLDLTKRDMADRAWYHRVEAQKAAKANDDTLRKLDHLVASRQQELVSKDQELNRAGVGASARRNYDDRLGATIRMEKRRKELEKEVENYFLRRWQKEEKLLEDMVQTFVKTQRSLILEERRLEREMGAEVRQKAKLKRDAQLNYMEDQLNLLKEELAVKKQEAKVSRQAQRQLVSDAIKSEKEKAKKELQVLKQKLQADADEDHFVNIEADLGKGKLNFKN